MENSPEPSRRTTYAVLITDVYQFSLISAQHEELVINRVAADLKEFRAICIHHGGRVITDRGDGLKMVFESAVECLRAAIEMQKYARTRTDSEPYKDRHVRHRMGVHFGDMMIVESPKDGEIKVTGSDVNIAARLEEACTPGQVCFSHEVYQFTKGRFDTPMRYMGAITVKNVPHQVRAWSTGWDDPYMVNRTSSVQSEELVHRALKRARDEFEDETRKIKKAWSTGFVAVSALLIAGGLGAWGWASVQGGHSVFDKNSDAEKAVVGSAGKPVATIEDKTPKETIDPSLETVRPPKAAHEKSNPPKPPEEPQFDADEVAQFRTTNLNAYHFKEVADYVAKIAHWANSETLKYYHDQALELQRGYSAFLNLVRKSDGHPAPAPNSGYLWTAIIGWDGSGVKVKNGDEDTGTVPLAGMEKSQREAIYEALANEFGPNDEAKDWVDSVDTEIIDDHPKD